jgi:hypothetical protein
MKNSTGKSVAQFLLCAAALCAASLAHAEKPSQGCAQRSVANLPEGDAEAIKVFLKAR